MGHFVNHGFVKDLIFGFVDHWNISRTSSIRIYGVSLEKMNESQIRENVSSLSEDPLLVHGDVRSNLVHYSGTSDEDVIRLLHYLKIHEVLGEGLLSLATKEHRVDCKRLFSEPIPPPENFQFNCSLRRIFQDHKIEDQNIYDALQGFLTFRVRSCHSGGNDTLYFNPSVVKIIEIARTILRQPDILFFRESSIDISGLNDKFFLDALFEFMPDTTIVYVCEDFDFIHMFDDIHWLEHKRIMLHDSPKNLLSDPENVLCKGFQTYSKKSYRFAMESLGIPYTKKSPMTIFKERGTCDTWKNNQKLEKVLQKVFKQYDADGNGTLDKEEMLTVFTDVCESLECPGCCT